MPTQAYLKKKIKGIDLEKFNHDEFNHDKPWRLEN